MKKVLFALLTIAVASIWCTSCNHPNNPEDPKKKDTTIIDPTKPSVVSLTIQAFEQVNATKATDVLTTAGYAYARQSTYSSSLSKVYGKGNDSIALNIIKDSVSYAYYFTYGTGNTIQTDFKKVLEMVGNTPCVKGVNLAFRSANITSAYGTDFPRTYTALHDSIQNDNTIRFALGQWKKAPYGIEVGGEFMRAKNITRTDFTVKHDN